MMKWLASILAGAMLPACLPEALDLAGKRCAADRPCGSGFLCVDGTCAEGDAGPGLICADGGCAADAGSHGPNLLVNGDFERSWQPEGWSSLTGIPLLIETIAVHEGAQALNVRGGASGLQQAVPPASLSQADALYCARAFVWGVGAEVVLAIVEGDIADPAASFESPAVTTSGKWTEIRSQGRARGGSPLTVKLWTNTLLGTFCVDDIELWISAGSKCD
jgi:hypothetical protein